jgi:hypothetical protein
MEFLWTLAMSSCYYCSREEDQSEGKLGA